MKSQSRSRPNGATSAASTVSATVALEGPSTGACTDILQEAGRASGIASVVLDTQHPALSFDYDPRVIDESRVARIAQEAAPQIEQRLETCTLRLGRKGGRACESCAAILEERLRKLPGVRSASASYRGGVLTVRYEPSLLSPGSLSRTVRTLGVPLADSGATGLSQTVDALDAGRRDVQPAFAARLRSWVRPEHPERWEALFTAITFVAMVLALALEQLAPHPWLVGSLYALAYLAGGAFGLKGGIEALAQRVIDIDLLMVLAALGAALVGAPFEGAMLLFLFSLSNVLQAYAMDRTRNAIKALMRLRPKTATVRRGTATVTLPIEEVSVGDVFLVRPGEQVALDGVVLEGDSTVDQASITGESMPAAKRPRDPVFGGTLNKNGHLAVTATKLSKDSTIAHLIRLVEEAHSEKARTQRFIDKFEQRYAVVVIAMTALAIVVPIFVFNEAFHSAFYRAMTIMVAASPCALVIGTPASLLSAIGNGARKGVLFKGGVHLEKAMTIKAVAFDKTGTLTHGKPAVTDVRLLHPASPAVALTGSEDELLAMAAAVQAKSEHALARATVQAASERNLRVSEAFAFQATTGKGVQGTVNGRDLRIGNLRYYDHFHCVGMDEARPEVARLEAEGKTCVVVAEIAPDGATAYLLGLIAFADVVRNDAASAVRELRAIGVEHVIMLTGDNRQVARVIGDQVGVDEVFAELLPEDKVRVIKELAAKYGPVAMVGDGVNDAPALATANVGIAMGAAGTDAALETADVVLMGDDLRNIAYVIELSRQTRKTLITNLAFATVMIGIMIAAIFVVSLPLPLAVVGHEGGTVLVSLNGLRLLLYKQRRRVGSSE